MVGDDDPPTVALGAATLTTDEDVPAEIDATVTDPDSTPTVTVTSDNSKLASGAFDEVNGKLIITPSPDINSSTEDISPTATITLTVDDGVNDPVSASVEVTVNAVNDPPKHLHRFAPYLGGQPRERRSRR